MYCYGGLPKKARSLKSASMDSSLNSIETSFPLSLMPFQSCFKKQEYSKLGEGNDYPLSTWGGRFVLSPAAIRILLADIFSPLPQDMAVSMTSS